MLNISKTELSLVEISMSQNLVKYGFDHSK